MRILRTALLLHSNLFDSRIAHDMLNLSCLCQVESILCVTESTLSLGPVGPRVPSSPFKLSGCHSSARGTKANVAPCILSRSPTSSVTQWLGSVITNWPGGQFSRRGRVSRREHHYGFASFYSPSAPPPPTHTHIKSLMTLLKWLC